MPSSTSPLPNPATPPSFWTRESTSIKQGIKTGLAGTITYALYTGFNLPQGYWAVFAALVVTQANLGASWKAALYRTIGSTSGALAAALLLPILGKGPAGVLVVLFLLSAFFGYLTALHPSFTAAGFTAALILVFGGTGEPWHMAWLRVLYTILGAVIAFAVGALIWPVRAREILRQKIANIVDGSGVLYRAVTAAALQGSTRGTRDGTNEGTHDGTNEGMNNDQQVRQLDRQLHDLRRGITQQMDEARSELAFSRFTASQFNQSAYQAFVDQADQVRRRLTAMAEDSSLYAQVQLQPELMPSLPVLAEKTASSFSIVAEAVRTGNKKLDPQELDEAVRALEADLARLREQRTTAPFALDRMLPFWSFVFNLREVAQDVRQLESLLPLA
jgi:uncharacterized membrane protein YccC